MLFNATNNRGKLFRSSKSISRKWKSFFTMHVKTKDRTTSAYHCMFIHVSVLGMRVNFVAF